MKIKDDFTYIFCKVKNTGFWASDPQPLCKKRKIRKSSHLSSVEVPYFDCPVELKI
jgi:hypothetical protein